jgi:hypothetical protein
MVLDSGSRWVGYQSATSPAGEVRGPARLRCRTRGLTIQGVERSPFAVSQSYNVDRPSVEASGKRLTLALSANRACNGNATVGA